MFYDISDISLVVSFPWMTLVLVTKEKTAVILHITLGMYNTNTVNGMGKIFPFLHYTLSLTHIHAPTPNQIGRVNTKFACMQIFHDLQ